jgi:hypothetical protein
MRANAGAAALWSVVECAPGRDEHDGRCERGGDVAPRVGEKAGHLGSGNDSGFDPPVRIRKLRRDLPARQ